MKNKYDFKDVEWIDLESPKREDVRSVSEEKKISPSVSEELLAPSVRQKVDLYKDYFYLVLQFPTARKGSSYEAVEIDFIVGKKFIITSHYADIDPLNQFSKIFEVNSVLDRGDFGEHAGFVLFHMLEYLYKTLEDQMGGIRDSISEIEKNIFAGNETAMVEELSKISRGLIDVKRALRPHRSILGSLEIAAAKFFDADYASRIKFVMVSFERIDSEVAGFSELVTELRETNDSLVSTKQNEVMKKLAIIAFIALPVGLVTALLQIDTVSRPFVGQPGDFWAILIFMGLIGFVLYAYTKSKKWL